MSRGAMSPGSEVTFCSGGHLRFYTKPHKTNLRNFQFMWLLCSIKEKNSLSYIMLCVFIKKRKRQSSVNISQIICFQIPPGVSHHLIARWVSTKQELDWISMMAVMIILPYRFWTNSATHHMRKNLSIEVLL